MKRFIKFTICIAIVTNSITMVAQSPYYLPGNRAHEINDRWDVLYWKTIGDDNISSIGNIGRKELFGKAKNSKAIINSSRDSVKAKLNEIYDGDYQGIFRGSAINTWQGYTKMDEEDAKYIVNDNVNYRELSFVNKPKSTKSKVYKEDGVFYNYESSKESTTIIETGVKFKSKPRCKIFRPFYKTPANFYEVDEDNFKLLINPMLNLQYGSAKDDENIVFKNVRGIELRGTIDKNFYFYSNIIESQARFNNFIERRINKYKAIPGQGAYKTYNSRVIEDLTGWDFLNSQAYVGANLSKSIAIEFGHGKHFIGNGIRSLILSDYANNYFYLKFNTRVWKFRLQNLFAELAPISNSFVSGDNLLPKKYMANHYLTYSPRKNMEIGLFETVVFSRQDQFELQYLNPIILYRTVEQFLDSPDNVLIGLTGKWNILKGVQLYGQLILDEFKLSELTGGEGWWANKYGIQTGIKYYNVANIDHLDIQAEYNTVRPYTYAHRDTLDGISNQNVASYSHYNQPLAHPLGSNFKEVLFEVRYRPTKNLFFKARAVKSMYGQDSENSNFGGNILLPLETREADYGNFTGQGISTNINIFSLDVSYQLYHNYHLDLRYLRRNEDASEDSLDLKTNYFGLGLRVNMAMVNWDY